MKTSAVGEAGFEPAASCSQSRRANQAALLPVADAAGHEAPARHRRTPLAPGGDAAAGVPVRGTLDVTMLGEVPGTCMRRGPWDHPSRPSGVAAGDQ